MEIDECCCGETDRSWILCPAHGVDDKNPLHPGYRPQKTTTENVLREAG